MHWIITSLNDNIHLWHEYGQLEVNQRIYNSIKFCSLQEYCKALWNYWQLLLLNRFRWEVKWLTQVASSITSTFVKPRWWYSVELWDLNVHKSSLGEKICTRFLQSEIYPIDLIIWIKNVFSFSIVSWCILQDSSPS